MKQQGLASPAAPLLPFATAATLPTGTPNVVNCTTLCMSCSFQTLGRERTLVLAAFGIIVTVVICFGTVKLIHLIHHG